MEITVNETQLDTSLFIITAPYNTRIKKPDAKSVMSTKGICFKPKL